MNSQSRFRLGGRVRSLATWVAVFLILGGIIIVFFNRLASGNLVLARGDTYLYFYPYWRAAAEALSDGRVPLWNPYLFMGAPFMANSQVGFFYPLNWPLWLLFSTPYAMSLSIIIHLLIAASGVYLIARRCLALSRPAATLAAVLFSLGGYLTAQVEHINQIQGIAWLPWYFVVLCTWRPGEITARQSLKLSASIATVLSLQILSGHTQTVFISLVAVAVWLFVTYFISPGDSAVSLTRGQYIVERARRAWPYLGPVALGILLAVGMTCIQLIPTLELSRHSIRQGGLPFNEVLSFSLQPLLLGQSLLPSYEKSIFSEYVVFVPISALLLAAIGADRIWRTKQAWPYLVLLVLGLLLALGRFNPLYHLLARLPGFNLFRAPARWSVLYALVIALLAAVGWQCLYSVSAGRVPEKDKRRYAKALSIGAAFVVILVAWSVLSGYLASFVPVAPETTAEGPSRATLVAWIVELVLAVVLALTILRKRASVLITWALFLGTIAILFTSTRILPYNHPTSARAYSEQRSPVSRLLGAMRCQPPAESCQAELGRLLGLSDIFFDLGDQPELDTVYGQTLGEQERFDYIVATKQKEVLGPNLPLAYGLRSVDGFDGGLLPLESYALQMSLILPDGEQTFDGRLREHLNSIPEERWLDHFGAKYIITDKVGDQWRQGIFFDMKHPATLSATSGTTAVGFLPAFEATDLYLISEGSPGTVMAEMEDGERWQLLPAMIEGDLWRVTFPEPTILTQLTMNPCIEGAEARQCSDGWLVKSLALVDTRDGTFMPLVIGDYRLVYSGDVKIYENLNVSPLASLLFDWQFVQDSQSAISLMMADGFEPEATAILPGVGPVTAGVGRGQVFVESYAPERIIVSTESDRLALLLVREAYYPSWRAKIDGEAAEIVQADIMLRGVFVPPGNHTIELEYRPSSYRIGLVISILCIAIWIFIIAYLLLLPNISKPRRYSPIRFHDPR